MVENFVRADASVKNVLLIYQATVNGWTADNFHQCCDGKGPTLHIIKTDKNRIFGGYTSVSWDKSG